MWRVAATVLVLWALGCGEDAPEREAARPEPRPTADDPRAPAGPCPEGTPFVRARDVIGPLPDDYRVARGDQQALRAIIEPFRRGLAARWRGADARVVARRTAKRGVAVIVVNSTEKSRGSEAIIAGAEDAERQFGTDSEPIRIAGQDGRIARARDGGYIAFGIAGECSTLVLIADTERLLRDAATILRSA